MRDIANKADNVDVLSGDEFNSYMKELENGVTKAGITLDPAAGADTSFEMLAQSMTSHAQGGQSYQDSGSANAYVLTAIGGFKQPSTYFDGQTISFKAGSASSGASTVNVSSLGVTDLTLSDGSSLSNQIEAGKYYSAVYNLTDDRFELSKISTGESNVIVQSVNTSVNTVATGTTVIPNDDTIPQNTEGLEAITLAITPTSATNKLRIRAQVNISCVGSNQTFTAALFQDSTASAIHAVQGYSSVNGDGTSLFFEYVMVAGTTSETTFKVRAASETSLDTTLNGVGGARRLGGVLAHTITIEEISV